MTSRCRQAADSPGSVGSLALSDPAEGWPTDRPGWASLKAVWLFPAGFVDLAELIGIVRSAAPVEASAAGQAACRHLFPCHSHRRAAVVAVETCCLETDDGGLWDGEAPTGATLAGSSLRLGGSISERSCWAIHGAGGLPAARRLGQTVDLGPEERRIRSL